MAEIDTQSLPFSPDKQKAVIGYLFYDAEFFVNVIQKLEHTWFTDEIARKIFSITKKRFKRSSIKPTFNEILEDYEFMKEPANLQAQIRATVSICKSNTSLFSSKNLLQEMETWMKARLVTLALVKAANSYNAQNIDEAANILNRMVKEYQDSTFFGDGAESFKNYGDELLAEEADRKRALTFGLEDMDRWINPTGEKGTGSLFRGDMTILMGSSNAGKSSALITVATHNIKRGNSVLYITHEGGKPEIKNKVMRALTGKTRPEMIRMYSTVDGRQWLEGWENLLERSLTYLPLNKPGLTVEEVALTVEKFQDKRKSVCGKGYDLLIDDYPAILRTNLASGGYFEKRHIDHEVYNQFVQMALQYDIHVLTAIQTNRDASRVNKRIGTYKNEKRLLQMEDVAESWGPMQAAATVITMNRSRKDEANKKLTYLLCKSRSSETGWAVVVNTDYDRCMVHSNELGCFSYRGEDSLSDSSASLMEAYKGQVLSSEQIEKFKQFD